MPLSNTESLLWLKHYICKMCHLIWWNLRTNSVSSRLKTKSKLKSAEITIYFGLLFFGLSSHVNITALLHRGWKDMAYFASAEGKGLHALMRFCQVQWWETPVYADAETSSRSSFFWTPYNHCIWTCTLTVELWN